jgi:hypothetical protein
MYEGLSLLLSIPIKLSGQSDQSMPVLYGAVKATRLLEAFKGNFLRFGREGLCVASKRARPQAGRKRPERQTLPASQKACSSD